MKTRQSQELRLKPEQPDPEIVCLLDGHSWSNKNDFAPKFLVTDQDAANRGDEIHCTAITSDCGL